MAIENDFLPFAAAGGANVITQAEYAVLAALASGFVSGEVLSAQVNKVLRQQSIMSAVLAQFIVDATGQTAIDDGTTATLITNLQRAIATYNVSLDSGVVNALAVTLNPPLAAYVPGMLLSIESIIATNTGTATVSVNGLAAIPITSAFGALQGGELFAGKGAILRINAAGTGAELIQTTGGTLPVKTATAAGQAVNLGQSDTRYVRSGGDGSAPMIDIAAGGTITIAQASNILQISGNATLPTPVGNAGVTIVIRNENVVSVVTTPAGGIVAADGTNLGTSWTMPATYLGFATLISDNSNWIIAYLGGRTIVSNAVNANEAVALGQGDGRYAALAGNAGQPFAVAPSGGGVNNAVNLGQFASSLGISGYKKYPAAGSPSGFFIEQWGSASISMVHGNIYAMTFPIAFPNFCIQVINNIGPQGPSTLTTICSSRLTTFSTTGYNFQASAFNGGTYTNTENFWAIGY